MKFEITVSCTKKSLHIVNSESEAEAKYKAIAESKGREDVPLGESLGEAVTAEAVKILDEHIEQ